MLIMSFDAPSAIVLQHDRKQLEVTRKSTIFQTEGANYARPNNEHGFARCKVTVNTGYAERRISFIYVLKALGFEK